MIFQLIEPPQLPLIITTLSQINNITILGSPGVGKTTLIHYALKKLKIPYKKLNHLQITSKKHLIQLLCQELAVLWKKQLYNTQKLSDFVLQLQEAQPDHYSYILVDAPSIPQRMIFEKLAIQPNLKLGFIFICNDLPIGLTFVIQPMDQDGQKKIIVNNLLYKSKSLPSLQLDPDVLENIFKELAHDVVQTFQVVTNNLAYLITISWDIFLQYKYPHNQLRDESSFKKDFQTAAKLLLQNPNIQMQSATFKRQFGIEQLQRQPIQEQMGQRQHVDHKNAIQTLEDVQIKLPKVSALLVLSCYLSQRNPEKTDKQMFKDCIKNKKSKIKEQQSSKQRVSIERIKCIFQSLISLTSLEDLDVERNAFDQTTRFYQQLNLLVEKGYLKIVDTINLKVECLVTEKQAFQLANFLGLSLYEFLYQQK